MATRRPWPYLSLIVVLSLSQAPAMAQEAPPQNGAAERPIDFDRDVRPIFQQHCAACHGEQKQESDFRLDRRDAALAGGAGGAAIVPGKSDDSPLVERIAGADPDLRMPPKGELLSKESVALIQRWIDAGAQWPADAIATASVKADQWSLQPLARPAVPVVPATAVVRNPIAAFVLATLAERGLHPSAEADRRTLIRRVTLDLTGLPPTSAEVATFLGDGRADAYEQLVDRLLASPRYGERWARHWMDVVHFGETHGND